MKIPADLDLCVVDPDPDLYHALAPLASSADVSLSVYASAEAFLESVPRRAGRLAVVASADLPGMDVPALIEALAARGLEPPVVALVPQEAVDLAVGLMRAGADDVLERPPIGVLILRSVLRTLERARRGGPIAAAN